MTASFNVSPSRTFPPGMDHWPRAGSLARRMSNTVLPRKTMAPTAQTGESDKVWVIGWRSWTFAFVSPIIAVRSTDTDIRETSMPLTKRQFQVLSFLDRFVQEKGYCPSFDEIGKSLRLSSLATVHKH